MRDHFGGVRFILYRCLPNLRVVRLEKNPETRLSRVQVFGDFVRSRLQLFGDLPVACAICASTWICPAISPSRHGVGWICSEDLGGHRVDTEAG